MTQKQQFNQFTELTASELDHITGGDWWTDFLNALPFNRKRVSGEYKYKLG